MPADLREEYMFAEDAAAYLKTTTRKLSLYRKYGLLRFTKLGKHFLYKRSWIDQFAEDWASCDISSEEKLKLAIKAKQWQDKHGRGA